MTEPVKFPFITCEFGRQGSWLAGHHTGIDYRAPVGTAIFATRKGIVIHSGPGGYGDSYGNHVVIESNFRRKKIRHLYAHLSKTAVSVGDEVLAGQVIGNAGETGNTRGPHLHYEERIKPFNYWCHIEPVLPRWKPKSPGWLNKILARMNLNKVVVQ